MNRWPTKPLGEFCRTGSGGTPSRSKPEYYDAGTVPWVKSGELRDSIILDTAEKISEVATRETNARPVPKNTVLVAMYGATVGKTAILGIEATTNQAVCHIIPDDQTADFRFVWYAVRSCSDQLLSKRVGGAQPNISQAIIRDTVIPVPPLAEQRRIVKLLDKADELRKLRAQADRRTATIIPSLFHDMFGDPAINPMGWPLKSLREVSEKFSDGPFGSNLKSSHYVPTGVRVIRLNNIGVGYLIDDDRAYIAPEHFEILSKHECLPGDVLVGTLGDPNLRACVLPPQFGKALNKADCVQIRPKKGIAVSEFICWLLNLPSTLSMASGMISGQTRSRISMGRLAELRVPVPFVALQKEFAARVSEIRAMQTEQAVSRRHLDDLFQSLLHRAFQEKL